MQLSSGAERVSFRVADATDVIISHNLLSTIGEEIARIANGALVAQKCFIVTDRTVAPLLAHRITASLRRVVTPDVYMHVCRSGEEAKCSEVVTEIHDFLLQNRITRSSFLVAIGGGVIGDLTGFCAASVLRGVAWINIPTTLLAMVDASVGGKTGIDTPAGKNLVGAFHHPRSVLVDPQVLATLPARHVRNGFAEIIKTAAIYDEQFFSHLETHAAQAIERHDLAFLAKAAEHSLRVKGDVVTRDERESGIRAILNFGHSVGHAIEALCQPRLLHGECVSIGMVFETIIARARGFVSHSTVQRIDSLCRACGLPVSLPNELSVDAVLRAMETDKKNTAGGKRIVLLQRLGCAQPSPALVSDEEISRALSRCVTVLSAPRQQPEFRIRVPGSKSLSNRALLIAALGRGKCKLTGLLHSDDTKHMLKALASFGCGRLDPVLDERTGAVEIAGLGGNLAVPDAPLYLGNAGTASRFLTAASCLARGTGAIELVGNARMHERPIGDLVDALRRAGCDIQYAGAAGSLPLRIRPTGLRGGTITLDAKVSSQFVSAILIAAPIASSPVILEIVNGPPVSAPYIAMTVALMREFGVPVQHSADMCHFSVPNTGYVNPEHYDVEADASSASYPLAIAAATGTTVVAEGIGSRSTQGDARVCEIFARMGCTVAQSAHETSVTGPPSGALRAVDVNMADTTDCFMTVAALAAIAEGTTRIRGIANQRVKECDRIDATVTALRGLGIQAEELDDGIQITGAPGSGALPTFVVDTHDDHRLAMSFAVLGISRRGVCINDPTCVNKTYPTFWDDLVNVFGCRVAAADDGRDHLLLAQAAEAPSGSCDEPRATPCANNASDERSSSNVIILIGMRAAGKTSLGKRLAQALQVPFRDMDAVFEKAEGVSIAAWVHDQQRGWDAFRARETELLASTLAEFGDESAVVACGGGIVETASGRALLRSCDNVIYLEKPLAHIRHDINAESRPSLGESLESLLARREDLYRTCSTLELEIVPDCLENFHSAPEGAHVGGREGVPSALPDDGETATARGDGVPCTYERATKDLILLVQSIRTVWTIPRWSSKTHFSSLVASDLAAQDAAVDPGDVDAVELRADALADLNADNVARQVALARRRTEKPIIFTLRSQREGGKFDETQPGAENVRLAAYKAAVRAGAVAVDIEHGLPAATRSALLSAARQRRHVGVIFSAHDTSPQSMFPSHIRAKLDSIAADAGRIGGVAKLVLAPVTPHDALAIVEAARSFAVAREQCSDIFSPAIVLGLGDAGRVTRAWNTTLTPVAMPGGAGVAAPGQIDREQLRALRSTLGIPENRMFYLFGRGIAASPSPSMHNAGFASIGMSSVEYRRAECEDMSALERYLASAACAGGSVTVPFKEEVVRLVDHLDPHAAAIGAVNTLVRSHTSGRLVGYNTDWIGVRNALKRAARRSHRPWNPKHALVIGAGGTARAAAFALREAGARVTVLNRTRAHAEALARALGDGVCAAHSAASVDTAFDAVVSTIPPGASVELPPRALADAPLCLDAAYAGAEREGRTAFLERAASAGCPIALGAEMLVEQAIAQFALFAGVHAPRGVLEKAARAAAPDLWPASGP